MNIQIFGSKKNNDSKKAERWFKERRIKYQYIDLYEKGLSLGEYRLSGIFPHAHVAVKNDWSFHVCGRELCEAFYSI